MANVGHARIVRRVATRQPASRTPSLAERTVAVRRQTTALLDAGTELMQQLQKSARTQVVRSPYRTLGIAVGVGYVLGGGLPLRVVGLLMGMGTRLAFEVATRNLVAQLAAPGQLFDTKPADDGEPDRDNTAQRTASASRHRNQGEPR